MEPVISGPALTESDRRLLEMAKVHRSDAALAVQFGVLTAEVQRRLDNLCARLGVASRQELREVHPSAFPPASESLAAAGTGDLPAPVTLIPDAAGVATGATREPAMRRRGPKRANGMQMVICAVFAFVALFFVAARVREQQQPPGAFRTAPYEGPRALVAAATQHQPRATLGRAVPFPAGVELVGIVDTEDGERSLARIWRGTAPGSGIQFDELLAPQPGSALTSAMTSPAGDELWAAVCLGCATGDQQTEVLRSSDMGVTWTTVATFEGRGTILETGDGAALMEVQGGVGAAIRLEVPAGHTVVPVAPAISVSTGSLDATTQLETRLVKRFGMPDVIVGWWAAGSERYAAVFRSDESTIVHRLATWELPAYATVAGFLYGTEGRPAQSIPPAIGAIETFIAPGWQLLRPALIDFNMGTVWPLQLPLTVVPDTTAFRPIAVREGRLVEVEAGEAGCLPLRATPEDGAATTGCVGDGVLVTLEPAGEDTAAWVEVSTPEHGRGWIPAIALKGAGNAQVAMR